LDDFALDPLSAPAVLVGLTNLGLASIDSDDLPGADVGEYFAVNHLSVRGFRRTILRSCALCDLSVCWFGLALDWSGIDAGSTRYRLIRPMSFLTLRAMVRTVCTSLIAMTD